MMKKLVLAGLLVCGMAAVLNAAPIVRIDFPCQNFWGELKCLDKLPDGVWIGERKTFYDKKKKGYTFPVFIDLAKTTEIDLTFRFEGKQQGLVRMAPALTGYADEEDWEMTNLQVVEFSVDGDKSVKAPATFKNWYSMTPFVAASDREIKKGTVIAAGKKYWQIFVTNGKTIKVHAKFERFPASSLK